MHHLTVTELDHLMMKTGTVERGEKYHPDGGSRVPTLDLKELKKGPVPFAELEDDRNVGGAPEVGHYKPFDD